MTHPLIVPSVAAASSIPRSRAVCLGLATLTVALGVTLRTTRLGIPAFAVKYGGSLLYAIMFYLLLAAFAPRLRVLSLALATFCLCAAIELFKLVHTPALDAFRLTLAGKLTLGRVFAVADLLAYAVGVCIVALADYQRTRGSRLA